MTAGGSAAIEDRPDDVPILDPASTTVSAAPVAAEASATTAMCVGRRRLYGDTFSRRLMLLSSSDTTKAAGTTPAMIPNPTNDQKTMSGSTYVRCPLCGDLSQKRYGLGRGIANHLQSIHTPWKPTKPSRRLARRVWERENRTRMNSGAAAGAVPSKESPTPPPELKSEYEPTPSEVQCWAATVARIVAQVEKEAEPSTFDATVNEGTSRALVSVPQPKDRSGQVMCTYKDSLPPFLQAAAIGQLDLLCQMVTEAGQGKSDKLLHQCDRHGSIAEHWAAGGGHLECLRFLMESKSSSSSPPPPSSVLETTMTTTPKRPRRRDGKTCLHYAARNGQLNCIQYLVEVQQMDLDGASGEGTTPLHMACYGGHLPAIHYFVEYAAKQSLPNPALAANEWACRASHWVAMTLNENAEQVWEICTYLQGCGVDFGARQHQGHSPLHKAAHRRNRHVLEWMVGGQCTLTTEDLMAAAAPDEGGHTPSDIWQSVGGDPDFFQWMRCNGL